MCMERSHLTVLYDAAFKFPEKPAFRIAKNSTLGKDWDTKTYQEFILDIEKTAYYWASEFASLGLPEGSIVGLWLNGTDYTDVVNIYGISRARFVPQLFSIRLPNPDVVYELLVKAGAKALVFDPSVAGVAMALPLPALSIPPLHKLISFEDMVLPPLQESKSKDELVFIFHTSGSTGGSPKLVPCSAAYVDSMIFKSFQTGKPASGIKQDVCTWMGSMCHIAQSFMLIGSIQHGACTIQPSCLDFSIQELIDMISHCGLNRLHQFATYLSHLLVHARENHAVLRHLQGLDMIIYSGLPLPQKDEEFCYLNKLNLVNLFGSTECGAMLVSKKYNEHEGPYLRPLEGVDYKFERICLSASSPSYLLSELVVLSSSPDCPHYSLRSADGHFHTGDLFTEARPGKYLFRGRDDDWIKSLNSLRCDTRSIEENVRATCNDLIENCVAVGTGRASPALFIELMPQVCRDHGSLKMDIMRRIRAFHSRRYLHERIVSAEYIFIVEPGTLPRTPTKGNISRKLVEEEYRNILDICYAYKT